MTVPKIKRYKMCII